MFGTRETGVEAGSFNGKAVAQDPDVTAFAMHRQKFSHTLPFKIPDLR